MKVAMLIALAATLGGCQMLHHGSTINEENGMINVSIGGESVSGSGKVETREVTPKGSFTAILAESALDVHIQEGEPKVMMTLDDNLFAAIPVALEGNTLVIRPTKSFSTKNRPKIVISGRNLDSLKLTGSSTFDMTGGAARNLKIEVQGASKGNLKGSYDQLTLVAQGASSVKATGTAAKIDAEAQGASTLSLSDLAVKTAEVSLQGASSGDLNVSEAISGKANGASTLRYKGTASRVEVSTSGASNVTKN